MTARIVRPRSDSPRLPLTLGGALLGAAFGVALGAKVFRPSASASEEPTASVEPARVEPTAPPPEAVAVVARPATPPAPTGPVIPVRVTGGTLSACGDGEELTLAPAQCEVPSGMESALRQRLSSVLPTCPAARAAAERGPGAVLSLGLRVDAPRRRVAVLLGRSSTVSEKVSYVACVRDGFGTMDELWRVPGQHPRYLFYFTARFGPMSAGTATPAPDPTPVPEPPVPVQVQVQEPTPAPAPVAAPAPAPVAAPTGLPTPAELVRMRALGNGTVTWSAAVVRDAPRTGEVVARLPQGTPVEWVDRRGGWYAIRWGRSNNVGWTYREAIGQ